MMLRNNEVSYGWVSIVIHWICAITIFFLFGLGLYMVELSYYDAWYKGSLDLHKSIGITLFFVWMFRIVWRLSNKVPKVETRSRLEKFEHMAAHSMHMALYVVVVCLMVSGYLISTADGRGISVFSFFEIPALPSAVENQEDLAGDAHWLLAWSLIAMVSVHALAALKHHLFDKDETLKKIIRPEQ